MVAFLHLIEVHPFLKQCAQDVPASMQLWLMLFTKDPKETSQSQSWITVTVGQSKVEFSPCEQKPLGETSESQSWIMNHSQCSVHAMPTSLSFFSGAHIWDGMVHPVNPLPPLLQHTHCSSFLGGRTKCLAHRWHKVDMGWGDNQEVRSSLSCVAITALVLRPGTTCQCGQCQGKRQRRRRLRWSSESKSRARDQGCQRMSQGCQRFRRFEQKNATFVWKAIKLLTAEVKSKSGAMQCGQSVSVSVSQFLV